MASILSLLAVPRTIDLILAVMLLEAVLLHRLGRNRGIGWRWSDVLSGLLPGALLLLAVRGALLGNAALMVLALLAALPAHLEDVARRLRVTLRRPPDVQEAATDLTLRSGETQCH